MAKEISELLLDRLCGGSWVGYLGETLIVWKLKFMGLFGYKGKILRNLYVPKETEDTSEIDVVYITEKGIFVIESKNYSGWIFGREEDLFWTASLPNRIKNRFYNPMKQNQSHMEWLKKYLATEIPLFSVIVFSERCELKKIQVNSHDIAVVKRGDMSAAITSVWKKQPVILNDTDIQNIFNKLSPLTHQSKEIRQVHVDTVQKKYSPLKSGKKTIAASKNEQVPPRQSESTADSFQNGTKFEVPNTVPPSVTDSLRAEVTPSVTDSLRAEVTPSATDSLRAEVTPSATDSSRAEVTPSGQVLQRNQLLCPRCGAKLVLRIAKKGKNAGKSFYGCSRYPHCHYIRN